MILEPIYRDQDKTLVGYMFYCPGCEGHHAYYIPQWDFNGNTEKPTFNPSLKNTNVEGKVCHLFVKNGMIEYCGDCSHHMRGRTVEMIELD